MVTANKYLKMLASDEEGVSKLIDDMSEEDAKAYLKTIMTHIIKQSHETTINILQEDISRAD